MNEMNETQQKVWNILCKMSGEEVIQLFADIYGTQVLDNPDVVKDLKLQGYGIEDEVVNSADICEFFDRRDSAKMGLAEIHDMLIDYMDEDAAGRILEKISVLFDGRA